MVIETRVRGSGSLPAGGVGGSANLVGPASSTDNAIARFDGTTGKLLQDSTVTVDDLGNVTVTAALDTERIPAFTDTNWFKQTGWENPTVGPSLIKNAEGSKKKGC